MGLRINLKAHGTLTALCFACLVAGCQTGEVAGRLAERQQLARAEQKNNIASLSEVIRHNPSDANALNLRGSAYGQSGEYEKALADFNAAIAINPNFPQAFSNRALVYARAKNMKQAIADYDQALSIDPNYTPALVGRGNVHRTMNNLPMAIADFSHAIEIQPDPVAYFNRGLSRQTLGQNAEALDDFDNTLSFRSDAPEVYQAKGLSELALKKYEGAFDDFLKAAQNSKDNFEAWALRGQAAEAMGARKEASHAYQRALQINPSFRPAREGLSRVGSEA